MTTAAKPVMGRPKQSSDVPLAGSRGLDRNSDVPLYFQLAAALKAMLEVGTWEPGARFASERELEEQFKVSRAVIRPALDLLVGDGAIFRVKGSGAFVAPPRVEVRVAGLVQLLLEGIGGRPINVLSARKRDPDHTVAHFLQIEGQQTQIAHVTAVVDGDQPSVLLLDSYCSVTLLPWLLPAAQALAAGRKPSEPMQGVGLTRATVSIEHTFFGEWGSSQVGASAGEPALMGRFVQFGFANGSMQERPLEFARLIYRADCAQLAVELSRPAPATNALRTNSAKASR
ncbi:MAG TPA: GntR family transcriptional regulator [Solirubrobacterales bacterium]|nr:GntR family transcriptional regulator [Solirubrobacterales bacterium]